MKTYNSADSYESGLEAMVGNNENIIWRGKPDKKCFILESIFNPLLPFALVWCIFDLSLLGATFSGIAGTMGLVVLGFMAIHMMPVWLYIGGIIMASRKYRNTAYIITDKGIYISSGLFSKRFEMKPFTDLSHINIHRGIFDQFLGVGDVVTTCNHDSYSSAGYSSSGSRSHSHQGMTICDIRDYEEVFRLIKDLQTDIYSDTMYPNDLRPESNHGYRTKYKNLE